MYQPNTYLAINPWSVHLYRVSIMVELCGRCGEPIRGFKGYDPEIGEICFTCYLEMLQSPIDQIEKTTTNRLDVSLELQILDQITDK